MISEIYIRDEHDPNFEPGIIEYKDEIESIVSQIKMLLETKPGDVLGDPDFGLDLEYYIFETSVNSEAIREKVNDAISMFVKHTNNTSVDVEVSFGKSARGYDYCVVDIIVNGRKVIGYLIDKD